MSLPRVLIIGASGNFGRRIARRLASESVELGVTSRSAATASALAGELKRSFPGVQATGIELDQDSDAFEQQLRHFQPDVVVHTAGPYQGQDYRVARACVDAGSHYVDLADGRDFVAGFTRLDGAARNRGVTLVSGASTLPGLSSAVIGHFKPRFGEIRGVAMSIAPAHQNRRGRSTARAVLSYCGKPIVTLRDAEQTVVYGWQDLRRQHYPQLGKRWSGACDVPDLALLPEAYPTLCRLSFHAALEAPWEQFFLYCLAALVRLGLIQDAARYASALSRLEKPLKKLGSQSGGMHIEIAGLDAAGKEMRLRWDLTAHRNHGPEIPCTPAIVMAKKLASGQWQRPGASPCMGLMTLAEFDREVAGFDIGWVEAET